MIAISLLKMSFENKWNEEYLLCQNDIFLTLGATSLQEYCADKYHIKYYISFFLQQQKSNIYSQAVRIDAFAQLDLIVVPADPEFAEAIAAEHIVRFNLSKWWILQREMFLLW